MADTTVATGLTVQQWDAKFFKEYLSRNRFSSVMGTSTSSIIQVKEDLMKKKGDRIHFALVNKLSNAAVTGSSTLEGNEESMDSRSFYVAVDKRRNAVRVAEIDEQYSAIGLRNAAKGVLQDWAMEDTRDLIIDALESKNGVAYASASEAQKDAWLVDNADRVLFGDAKGNNAGNDHSAALTAVTSSMTLGTAEISLMKRMAKTCAPKVRPVRDSYLKDGREYFVLYVHPLHMRDLKADTAIQQAQREVALTKENARLFEGGDVLWDGVIVKEIEDINVLANVGAGGTVAVAPAFLCGAQAVGAAYAKRWRSKQETFDYGDKQGCAIDAIYGIEKLTFGSGAGDTDDLKDHGVVTGYFAAVADA